MNRLCRAGMLAALVLAGCQAGPSSAKRGGLAALEVRTALSAGGFRTQTLQAPWSASDVSHLVVKLLTVAGNTESPVTAEGGSPVVMDLDADALAKNGALVFGGLLPDTTYRVRAVAYRAAGTAEADILSKPDQFVDVAVGRDDRPTIASLDVHLIDKYFDGQATSSITFTDGEISDGTPSLAVEAATP